MKFKSNAQRKAVMANLNNKRTNKSIYSAQDWSEKDKEEGKIHWIKKAPIEVWEYYDNKFPKSKGFTYKLYSYLANGEKIFAAEVYKNGSLYDNSTQASREWYNQQVYGG